MIILPAIDLLDGQVVRLRQGQLDQRTVYPEDALYYASRWEEEGGNCLHVVDLNAAFTGEHGNLKLIEKLVSSLNIPVQVGGGVRSVEAAQRLLGAGAARVVVGTRAVQDRDFLSELVKRFGGDKVAVSVDTKGGKVAVKGWAEVSELNALEFVRQIDRAGIGSVIFTDIATDGMLSGPNFAALEKVLAITRCEVISSGGVATIEHVSQLAAIPGLHGAIIGKALFDGTVDLAEAVAVANAGSDAKGAV
jgi:phosphoribosylformimino-5-aminoimidazole carboxamide ribotide isomerase